MDLSDIEFLLQAWGIWSRTGLDRLGYPCLYRGDPVRLDLSDDDAKLVCDAMVMLKRHAASEYAAIELRYLRGRTVRDIARHERKSVATIKNRLMLGRQSVEFYLRARVSEEKKAA